MGTDIHLVVEKKNQDGTWERVLPPEDWWKDDPWKSENYREYYKKLWFNDRNYRLFAVLADVRNGYGFAGVKTGEPIIPISYPKGIPHDLSQEVQDLIDNYKEDDVDLGDHSFSWLTLKELQDYDWNKDTQIYGVVSLEQFEKRLEKYGKDYPLKLDTSPYESWSGGISGPDIVTINAEAFIKDGYVGHVNVRLHIQDSWFSKIYLDEFNRMLNEITKLDSNPENIRIVFGFDS